MSEHGCLSSAPCLLCSGFHSCRSQAGQAAGLPEFENEAACRSFLWLPDFFNPERLARRVPPHFHISSSSPWRRQRQIGAVTRSHPTPLPRHHGRGARRCQVLPAPRRDPLGVYQASVRSFLCASMRAPQPATALPLIFGGAPERVVGNEIMVATMEAWFGACFGVDVCGLIGLWVVMFWFIFVHISLWHISRCHRINVGGWMPSQVRSTPIPASDRTTYIYLHPNTFKFRSSHHSLNTPPHYCTIILTARSTHGAVPTASC